MLRDGGSTSKKPASQHSVHFQEPETNFAGKTAACVLDTASSGIRITHFSSKHNKKRRPALTEQPHKILTIRPKPDILQIRKALAQQTASSLPAYRQKNDRRLGQAWAVISFVQNTTKSGGPPRLGRAAARIGSLVYSAESRENNNCIDNQTNTSCTRAQHPQTAGNITNCIRNTLLHVLAQSVHASI